MALSWCLRLMFCERRARRQETGEGLKKNSLRRRTLQVNKAFSTFSSGEMSKEQRGAYHGVAKD